MCEYCGCRDITLIGRLSEEHYQAVDGLGRLQAAIASGDGTAVETALDAFTGELFPHNDSEEAGLFHELIKDEYFEPTVRELLGQHRQFRELCARIGAGAWDAVAELEDVLRRHIDREENGLFPATAVAVDGPTWEEIDRLTHDFNHEHHREHGHTEAERLAELHAREAAGPVVEATGGFGVRPATMADAASLVALWTQAKLTVDASAAEDLRATIALHPELVLVATSGDSIVGSVWGTWDGRRARASHLVARRDWAGRGVGAHLMAAFEASARGLGARRVDLLIDGDDFGVVGFLERLGYVTQDAIALSRPLEA